MDYTQMFLGVWPRESFIAGKNMPVGVPENVIVLVRALHAEHLLLCAQGEKKVHLSAVVQECVALLEGMMSLEPTGSAAKQAHSAPRHLDWAENPWRQFIIWLVKCLPVVQSAQ